MRSLSGGCEPLYQGMIAPLHARKERSQGQEEKYGMRFAFLGYRMAFMRTERMTVRHDG
jgi:hypothetical protein